jgi:hypothetical protein
MSRSASRSWRRTSRARTPPGSAPRLKAAKEKAEQTRLAAEGVARRVQRAEEEAQAYRQQHARELLSEREPEARTLAEQLNKALEVVVRLDAAWRAHAQATDSHVADMPGASPRYDAPKPEHPFSSPVRSIKDALASGAEVRPHIPHFEGVQARERQDHAHRLLRTKRTKADLSDAA